MNIRRLIPHALFRKKERSTSLIPFANAIWRATIFLLIVLLASLIAFDAYIFFYRVQTLEKASIEVVPGGGVPEVDDALLKQAIEIFEKREGIQPSPISDEVEAAEE